MVRHDVAGKYVFREKLACGGCATVYVGYHRLALKEVAIKVERVRASAKGTKGSSPLTLESRLYKRLMGGPGIPWMVHSGRFGKFNVMVTDLLGSSLHDLLQLCNGRFSLKTTLLLADQLITRIEFLHSRSVIHRDIKPSNFVMGVGKQKHLVHVIDFGLAKKFQDRRQHIPLRNSGRHGVGTSVFASLNTHLGIESSRRDDIESLAYTLIYFAAGTLPWQDLPTSNQPSTWDAIYRMKLEFLPILGVGLEPEFGMLLTYARSLAFSEKPSYEQLRALFRGLAARREIQYDGVFDWFKHQPFQS